MKIENDLHKIYIEYYKLFHILAFFCVEDRATDFNNFFLRIFIL